MSQEYIDNMCAAFFEVQAAGRTGPRTWNLLGHALQDKLREAMKAALKVGREPTVQMKDAGRLHLQTSVYSDRWQQASDLFGTMIDKACE